MMMSVIFELCAFHNLFLILSNIINNVNKDIVLCQNVD